MTTRSQASGVKTSLTTGSYLPVSLYAGFRAGPIGCLFRRYCPIPSYEEQGVSAYNHRSFLFLVGRLSMSDNDDGDDGDKSDGDDESPHALDVLRAIRMAAEIVMLVARLVGVR